MGQKRCNLSVRAVVQPVPPAGNPLSLRSAAVLASVNTGFITHRGRHVGVQLLQATFPHRHSASSA